MRISKMLEQMVLFGVSGDTSENYIEEVYLNYLNRANEELYDATASFNDDLVVKEYIDINPNNSSITLTYPPFSIRSVYINNDFEPLEQYSSDKFERYKAQYNSTGYPQIFKKRKSLIEIYPTQTDVVYNLAVRYIPQPTELTLSTNEDDIPYPIAYHHVLVKGALRYVFMDEEGFSSTKKSDDNNKLWEMGKQDLISYLFNSSSEKIGTFSSV